MARLDGTIKLEIAESFKPRPGKSFVLLQAKQLTGTFANAEREVIASDGRRFQIDYSGSAVRLTLL